MVWEGLSVLLLIAIAAGLLVPRLIRRGPRGDALSGTLLITGVSPRPDATGEQYVTITGVIDGPTLNEYTVYQRMAVNVDNWPTVGDLKDSYAWDEIGPKTRFVGLVGPVERQTAITARLFNAAFRQSDDRHRCLPLPVQSFDRLLTRPFRAENGTSSPKS